MNRLLINMENKIDILNGAMGQLRKLRKGEIITLNGLNKISISRGEMTNDDIDKKAEELHNEICDLEDRCERMRPEVNYDTRY